MSLIEALSSFLQHLKLAQTPVFFSLNDDALLFLINVVENIFDFENVF
jgi:hypothetical protein